MDELQGLNYIDKDGYCKGIIEKAFYSTKIGKYIVCYKTPELKYYILQMKPEAFNLFNLYAGIRSERYDIIKNKSITDIYHFSPVENTASILEYGIFSRDFTDLLSIPSIITDQNRFDGELNKISASISFPNYKMKYSLELHGFRFVIYNINPRILLTKLDTQFYHTNAAKAIFYNIDKRNLTTNDAFLNMFYQDNRHPNIPDNYTTDPQAEVLIDSCIPNDYIEEIIVNNDDKDIEKLCEEKRLKYTIDRNLHRYRIDWRQW